MQFSATKPDELSVGLRRAYDLVPDSKPSVARLTRPTGLPTLRSPFSEPPRRLSENRLIYCGQAWLARFPDHNVKEHNYSPQMIEKSDSTRLALATISIPGQPPSAAPILYRWINAYNLDLISTYYKGLDSSKENMCCTSEIGNYEKMDSIFCGNGAWFYAAKYINKNKVDNITWYCFSECENNYSWVR